MSIQLRTGGTETFQLLGLPILQSEVRQKQNEVTRKAQRRAVLAETARRKVACLQQASRADDGEEGLYCSRRQVRKSEHLDRYTGDRSEEERHERALASRAQKRGDWACEEARAKQKAANKKQNKLRKSIEETHLEKKAGRKRCLK